MTIAVVFATLLFVAPLHAQLTIGAPADQVWVDAGMDAAGPSELAQAPPTQRLRMPDLRKHTLNDALEVLSRYHRRPRVEQGPSALPKGLVYDQKPPPGTDLATVREIVLHVSDGSRPPSELPPGRATRQLRMPDLRRQTLQDAVATLSRYERKPRVEHGFSDLARGLVYAQEPPPGTDLATVREIVLHVSDGSKPPSEFPPGRTTRQLRMPDLRKHTLKDAVGVLSEYHRKPRAERGSSNLPEGLVYDQEPPPGTDLAAVREIVLHVSSGVKPKTSTVTAPPSLRMPDLRRLSLKDAIVTLSKYHRRPRAAQGPSELPQGLVYDQEPPPGTDLATVSEIVLHVSNGVKREAPTVTAPPTLRMPDVKRHNLTDALGILAKYNRKPRVERGSSKLPEGLVFDQEPPPGTDLATVRVIVLHVSNGVKPEVPTVTAPPPLRMPDVRKRSLKNAFAALSKYQGEPRVEHGDSDLGKGLVYDQEPPPGTDLATVHSVVLYVSDGPKPSPTHPTSEPTTHPGSAPPTQPTSAPPTSLTSTPPTHPTSVPPTRPASEPATPPTSAPTTHPTSVPPTPSTSAPPTPSTSAPPTPPISAPPPYPAPTSAPPSGPPLLLWGAAAALVATSVLGAAQAVRHLRWKRVSKMKVSLDLAGASSVSPLTTAAPSVGLQAHLEMGDASPVGPIPVKTEEQRHE